MNYNNKFRFAGTYGLCIGVVFGTAASYFGRNSSKSYVNIMSKYITGSAVSIVALLSIKGLINKPSTTKTKQTPPLEHLRLLNYQSYSISSIPLSSTTTLPSNIHRRK